MKRHHGASDAPRSNGEGTSYYMSLTAVVCLALVGCPQTLGDDFTLADPHSSSANGGRSGRDTQSGITAEGGSSDASAGSPALGGTSSVGTATCSVSLGRPAPIAFSDASVSSTLGISGPALSSDGLTLYFVVAQSQTGLDQIYRATRATLDSLTFSKSEAVFANTTEARGTPALTSDDSTLYFYATRWNGMGDRDLWFVKRSSANSAFGEVQSVTAVNTTAMEHHPFLTQDQLALYYVSVQFSGGYYPTSTNSNIWRVTRTSTDQAFANPVEVEELNSPYRDQRVAITANGRVVYFATDRGDNTQLDLWVATRATQRGTFEPPQPVADASVNSLSDEKDVALSPKEDELFFASNRDGQEWIYRSTRSCQ
jgi:hypothetical protein